MVRELGGLSNDEGYVKECLRDILILFFFAAAYGYYGSQKGLLPAWFFILYYFMVYIIWPYVRIYSNRLLYYGPFILAAFFISILGAVNAGLSKTE